ncbi:MAG: aminopeptidase P family protein [Planctomycetes bacterium]|nr:aminopeptidase P family protein [Planctomycetota bacterium]
MALALIALALACPAFLASQAVEPAKILPQKERAALMDAWLRTRLDTLVPVLMRREGIDCWILVAREYDEDPVVETMLPATWLRARRRTILVFHDLGQDRGVERFSISRYDVGGNFPGAWNPAEEPDQYKRLASLVAERDPDRIGIDRSLDFALADGLSSSEHERLRAALPERLRERLVSAETLAVGWLETRAKEELALYPSLCALAHRIIAEGFAAVRPGSTTTEDLEWWYRERLDELRLDTWFHPSVSVQRAGGEDATVQFAKRPGAETIRPGDLVHLDFGLTYLRLNTDTQQNAYVLATGESEPPAGLVRALAVGNRLQDVLTDAFQSGRSGNEILAAALERARSEGIEATIYSHPLGFHGHGAGPSIGMWDQQGGVPGTGDQRLRADTVYAIELAAAVAVPEWGGAKVKVQLEEDAWFDGERVRYLDGRQTVLHLIAAE